MLEILKTLKDTPLPIVLVIGGLIFLLIPFIQKISSKEVGFETTNQSFAGIIGFILLATGIGLYIIPPGATTAIPHTTIPPVVVPSTESQNSQSQPTNVIVQSESTAIQTKEFVLSPNCDGMSWANCWQIDESTQTITWVGFVNGVTDIAQDGVALQKIKAGYTAIVTLDVAMTINICTGTINGIQPSGTCPKILPISAGTHRIISPGESGGFRIYP
ncbi:MAG: hypothetical protein JNK81_05490 [Anaerolineales bacterium]|nr:hypothetical protein [Anaerolineales bacterium]